MPKKHTKTKTLYNISKKDISLKKTTPHKRRNYSADKRIQNFKTEDTEFIKHKRKKFNEEEFQKQLKSFELWEKKKNEKIEALKKKKIQKELDSVNNKANIHYKKKN